MDKLENYWGHSVTWSRGEYSVFFSQGVLDFFTQDHRSQSMIPGPRNGGPLAFHIGSHLDRGHPLSRPPPGSGYEGMSHCVLVSNSVSNVSSVLIRLQQIFCKCYSVFSLCIYQGPREDLDNRAANR